MVLNHYAPPYLCVTGWDEDRIDHPGSQRDSGLAHEDSCKWHDYGEILVGDLYFNGMVDTGHAGEVNVDLYISCAAATAEPLKVVGGIAHARDNSSGIGWSGGTVQGSFLSGVTQGNKCVKGPPQIRYSSEKKDEESEADGQLDQALAFFFLIGCYSTWHICLLA
jgi:hypothetical protein